jgi:hypothetical protein
VTATSRLLVTPPGGKLGLSTDADCSYILLAGINALLAAVVTVCYARHHPFPSPREALGNHHGKTR